MSETQLHISFAGLSLFNFDRPLKGSVKPTQAQVLLPKLIRARPLSRVVNSRSEVLDQHFPLLEFDLANWNPASTRKADFHCLPDASGKMTKGVCLLIGEDLKIRSDGDPGPLRLSRSEPLDTIEPQSSQDLETLWWTATLEEVFPNNPLDPGISNITPGSNQAILARVTLDQGYLRTQELTDAPCTIVGSGASQFNRRVATTFALDMACQKTVEIEMTRSRNGKQTTSKLILNSVGGADLQIGISNMEIDRFIGIDPASGPHAQADFEIFTDLLMSPVPDPKPFLLESAPGGSSGCCGMANCMVAGV